MKKDLKTLIGTHSFEKETIHITLHAVAKLPTEYGDFLITNFTSNLDNKEHLALIKGDIIEKKDILVRIHSECFTGDVFHSLKCDCNKQLQKTMRLIEEKGKGMILYMRQEGRGIGLTNKLKAYMLQDEGLDTYEANKALGFKEDERDYTIAVSILKIFKIISIQLLTNNPSKVEAVEKSGIKVIKRIPLIMGSNKHNKNYLEIKKEKGNHLL